MTVKTLRKSVLKEGILSFECGDITLEHGLTVGAIIGIENVHRDSGRLLGFNDRSQKKDRQAEESSKQF
jgi:hypothetical protein